MGAKNWTVEEVYKIIALKKSGKSDETIACIIGCAATSVSRKFAAIEAKDNKRNTALSNEEFNIKWMAHLEKKNDNAQTKEVA